MVRENHFQMDGDESLTEAESGMKKELLDPLLHQPCTDLQKKLKAIS